jgi:uncharacterized protein YutE (UPF0331/DUF86 family)
LSSKDPEAVDLLEWRRVIGLRNALVHDYLNIDPAVIASLIGEKRFGLLVNFAQDSLSKPGQRPE